jgi:ferredoxin
VARLVERHDELFDIDPEADKAAVMAAAEAGLTRTERLTGVGEGLRQGFAAEHWQQLGLPCLGCGACAFTCPTCHCFDIIDRGDPEQGERLKIWDCCAFKTFTVHASGHNPRPTQTTRLRQRIMHKLSYFPERFGRVMCVGCGRCLRACPAGQDIYEAALAAATAELAKGEG